MLLTLLQSGPCEGIISYTIDGITDVYISPITISPSTTVEVNIQYAIGWDDPCCFVSWTEDWSEVSAVDTYSFRAWDEDQTLVAFCNRCDWRWPCTPRYKDIDTLVARTNCMCSKLGVEPIQLWPRTVFAIIDKCIEEDEFENPFNLGFHVITLVMDPNYLMQTMECLCDNRNSNPEYITVDPN